MIRTENLVVGAGLFGCIIAAALRKRKQRVLVVADQRPSMGSRPAACLMKPSWFASGIAKEEATLALELLDSLYGLQTLQFDVGLRNTKVMTQNVHWVSPRDVLKDPDVVGVMSRFRAVPDGWLVQTTDGTEYTTRRLILALGIWQNSWQPDVWPKLKGLHGMAMLYPGRTTPQPFIKPWAPYRQLVGFNRGDGLWVGDGSAIKAHNWTDEHATVVENRCRKAVGASREEYALQLHGVRPYADDKPCLLRNPQPGLWFASGGAKNGTIAAAWAANQIAGAA